MRKKSSTIASIEEIIAAGTPVKICNRTPPLINPPNNTAAATAAIGFRPDTTCQLHNISAHRDFHCAKCGGFWSKQRVAQVHCQWG